MSIFLFEIAFKFPWYVGVHGEPTVLPTRGSAIVRTRNRTPMYVARFARCEICFWQPVYDITVTMKNSNGDNLGTVDFENLGSVPKQQDTLDGKSS